MPRTASARKTAKTPRKSASAKPVASAADKERPLVDDIRLLGRILGDVIREQEGAAAFELVERVRQLVGRLSPEARRARRPRARPPAEEPVAATSTVSVIRAFSYFSHLANIAEDRHHLRRRAAPRARRATCSDGSLAMAFERLARRGIDADRHRRRRSNTPSSRRCSPPTRPRCSARASSTPSAPSPSCWPSATTARRARASWRATRRCCAPASRSSGRRACCATPSSPSPTRSRTRSATTARPSCAQIPTLYREIEDALPGHAIAPLLPHGQLDRRRPRRQPERHRRDAAHRARAPERDGAAPLPDARSTSSAPSCRSRRRWRRSRPRCRRWPTRSRRPQRAPRGRALPARADRRLRAPGGDAARAHRHRGAAPRGRAAATPYASAGRARSPTCARHRALAALAPRRRAGARRAWRR